MDPQRSAESSRTWSGETRRTDRNRPVASDSCALAFDASRCSSWLLVLRLSSSFTLAVGIETRHAVGEPCRSRSTQTTAETRGIRRRQAASRNVWASRPMDWIIATQ